MPRRTFGLGLCEITPTARAYLAYTLFNSIGFAMLGLVFNLYLHSLGHNRELIGLVNGVPAITVLLVGLPVGIWADRIGYRPFLVAGALLDVVALGGMAYWAEPLPLLAFSILRGVAWACTWVLGAPLLMAESTPENRVQLFALNSALTLGAGPVGSLLGGFLPEALGKAWQLSPNAPEPLRATFAVAIAFLALAVLPTLFIRSQKRLARGSPLPRTREEVLLFARLLLPGALVSFGAGAMVVFFQLFFSIRFGMEPGAMGVIFALASVATAVATLLTPSLSRRLGKVRTVVVTQLASIPFLLLLTYSHHLPLVVGAYYMRHILMNMSWPVGDAFILEQVRPEQRATLTSLDTMLGSLGRGGLGPVVSGWMQMRWDFTGAFTLTTVAYVAGALLFYLFFRKAEEPERAPAPVTTATR
ncbi:MAG TPA: MFS transporter [Limnochorda sp.]